MMIFYCFQAIILVIIISEVLWRFLNTVYIVMAILLIQGLIEGAAYRHTIYRISSEVSFFINYFDFSDNANVRKD